jgi:protein arginine N-methyltransferase 5
MSSNSNNLIFGYKTNFVNNIRELLTSQEESVNFVVLPLFHPRFRRDNNGISLNRNGSGTRSDRELESKDWISNVVGLISNWIDLDNSSSSIAKNSEVALKQEFQWSSHLGLQAILLPKPSLRCQNYARCVSQLSNDMSRYLSIYIYIFIVT